MLVNVKGDVLGHVFSYSQSPSTPPKIHSLVISVECGNKPL